MAVEEPDFPATDNHDRISAALDAEIEHAREAQMADEQHDARDDVDRLVDEEVHPYWRGSLGGRGEPAQ